MWKPVLLALAVASVAGPSLAASCGSEIESFERQHNLSAALPRAEALSGGADTPATAESRGLSPDDSLDRSGGVLAPPQGGRTAVIAPPPTGPGSTPTAPAVPPHTAKGPSASAGPELSASSRAQVQAHLNAAREADGRGDEKACFERLGEARAAARSS